jgi:hypothetical protein
MAVLPAVTAVLFVPGKRGNGGSAAVTAVLLVPVKRGNGGSACCYCNTVTSLNNCLRSNLYRNVVLYFPSHSPLKNIFITLNALV